MRIKYFAVVAIAITLHLQTNAQSTTVYTCKGGAVAAHFNSEFTPQQITDANTYIMNQWGYLGITFLENSSNLYNCHSYAWHLREGNTNKVWIDNATWVPSGCYPETHNIDKYWTDKCFIQVCNESDADKVHYYCGDHSAVASTTNPGYFESKWGNLAVVRHTRTGVGYEDPVNSVHFYASTKMDGATTNLCSGTRTFSVKNISGATYTWTWGPALTVVGATNTNQLVIQQNGAYGSPTYVQVEISTPCSASSVTVRKDFQVGTPSASPVGTYFHNGWYYPVNIMSNPASYGVVFYYNNMCSAATTSLTLPPGSTTSWSLASNSPSSPPVYWYPTNQDLYVTLAGTQSAIFNLTYTNSCGSGITFYVGFRGGTCNGFRSYYTISSNPVRSSSKLKIQADQLTLKEKDGHNTITEVIIYDQQGQLKKRQKFGKATQASVDLTGLNTGVYVVEIVDGMYRERRQLIVQK